MAGSRASRGERRTSVGNHGLLSSGSFTFKSPHYVRRDVIVGETRHRARGASAPHFFRAPHGFRSPWVSAIAGSLGERTIGWSLGVWDSDQPGLSDRRSDNRRCEAWIDRLLCTTETVITRMEPDADRGRAAEDHHRPPRARLRVCDAAGRMNHKVARNLRWLLTAVILAFLVVFARTIDWGAAWSSMRHASLPLS
jgi:hypothetical protein